MKKMDLNVLRLLAFFVFLLLATPASYGFDFGARGYYWRPNFSGEVRADQDSTVGTTINAKDDLGMEDEGYPTLELFFGHEKHHLVLTYTKADYTGKKNIDSAIVFNGETFALNTFVESDLEFQMLDLEYSYNFINLENLFAGFSAGILAKAKYIAGETSLQARGLGLDEGQSFRFPVPMLGLGIHVGLLADVLEARVKGAAVAYSGSTFYDSQADIAFTPIPFVAIHGGYRIMRLKIDDISDFSADIEFKGPYAGLTISY